MKLNRAIMPALLAAFSLLATPAHAEDIDIYSGLGSTANVPNVMIVMDNAANFSSNSAGSSCIIDGVATALSGTVGGIEQCALYNVISTLPTNADGSARLNIGMMVYNANNIRDVNNLNCGASSSTGGCLAQPLIPMDAANKVGFLAWIKSWVTTGGAGSGYVKASGEATAAAMQETWAYYHGSSGLSGRNYSGIQPASGCQKNFVIFIGNSYSSAGTPGDGDSVASALNNAPGVTAEQKALILNTVNSSCGAYTFPSSAHENKGFYADEWARYMYQADLYGSPDGTQSIVTYSVGILGASCQAEYAATLTNMAHYGGGKYFATSNYNELVVAIMKILNEVQAVNSVFSSSSLPVSVNAQGTYLNQIYMGMFRPDPGALPRWVGNLKQYQFIINSSTGDLQLGDSLDEQAIDSSGTGFLSPNAVSFWTCSDNGNPNLTSAQKTEMNSQGQICASDPDSGFYLNFPSMTNSAGKAFDAPDGQLVEKGGAAQQIRLTNLAVNYATEDSTATYTRKLYTYCPSGASCNANLTNAANRFAATNANITAAMFGGTSSVNVSTLTRSGTTVMVTTTGNHGFTTGDTITIANATQSEYNGNKTIAVTDNTHFTYTVTEYPPTPATGSFTVSAPGTPVSATITRSGSTVTVSAPGHAFSNGNIVTINGANQTEYNGSHTISGVVAGVSFQYSVTESPVTAASGGTATGEKNATGACPAPCMVSFSIASVTRSGTTVTVTTSSNNSFISTVGKVINLSGVVDGSGASVSQYNGNVTTTSWNNPTNNRSFTFTVAVSPATPATGTITANLPSSTQTITALVRSGNTATATVAGHGFSNGDTVTISGTPAANEAAYTGSYTISNVTANTTFDYTLVTTPATPATGVGGTSITATRSTGFAASDREDLINWVRGEDNYGDETGPGGSVTVRPSLHGDVLHSRPTVINYGGTNGVVVYYGDNGGVFHAVNGNQTNPAGSTLPAPGNELWGFIPSEHYIKLNRLRTNSPQLNLPSTPPGILPAPSKKDYFVDGPTGVYQLLDGNGNTLTAYLYLSMRRGGRLIYAIDVTNPQAPAFLWKKDNTSAGMSELGQTWSAPKVARIKGHANPVLIFAGGYDTNQDVDEIVDADTMGRAIFILDAITGDLVWKAVYDSSASGTNTGTTFTTTGNTAGSSMMRYSIPSDITLMDRNRDGYIDRLYTADTGGQVWRGDLESSADGDAVVEPGDFKLHRLASLGECSSTVCRKFFYPPEVISTTSYDAVILASGDREHPLFENTAATGKQNMVFLLKDTSTGNDATGMTRISLANGDLFNATSTAWGGTMSGYYIELQDGEKAVNAPLVVAGHVYFGTNQPTAPAANSCTATLGTARAYQLSPFTASYTNIVLDGGGLPPSPVAGVVSIVDKNGEEKLVPFVIGAGNPDCTGADCASALGGQKPPIAVSTSRIRTYWYKKGK